MFSKFLNLQSEKQERILNAAMKEFAQKGFKNASTDEIVKEANISKGALFHYFNNKKDLFLFLYDYSIKIFIVKFFEKIDLSERDILLRWRQIGLLKIELIKQYPELFDFLLLANIEEADEVKRELDTRNQEIIIDSYNKLFKDIDTSKFKESVDVKRSIDIIIWTMEGITNREKRRVKTLLVDQAYYDHVLADMEQYIEVLRECFYKSDASSL